MQATVEGTVVDLEAWLCGVFPGSKVEHGSIFDNSYVLFRVYRADDRVSEIQFAKTALEDFSSTEILRDLETASAATQMRTRTSHRFTYDATGHLTPIERMFVPCDGVTYRVVRNPDCFVAVLDEMGEHLPKMPRWAALPGSVFHRHASQWRDDIRKWR